MDVVENFIPPWWAVLTNDVPKRPFGTQHRQRVLTSNLEHQFKGIISISSKERLQESVYT
jgi:hypothetical protein